MRGPRLQPGAALSGPPARLLRLDLPGKALGFERPPMPMRLRFLPRGPGPAWTLLVLVPAGGADRAVAWLRRHVDAQVAAAPGLAPRTLRCELASLPAPWLKWLSAARVVQVDLARTAMATLFVHGTGVEVAHLAAGLGNGSQAVRAVPVGSQRAGVGRITQRQQEVLSNAVALGYYDIPHRIDLRGLGQAMGLSASAVSLLLRRAQGKVVREFIDATVLGAGESRLEPWRGAMDDPPKRG